MTNLSKLFPVNYNQYEHFSKKLLKKVEENMQTFQKICLLN